MPDALSSTPSRTKAAGAAKSRGADHGASGGVLMAAELLSSLGDRTQRDPAMRAEFLGVLRQLLHICVQLAFMIDARTGNATLAAVAEVSSAWDAEAAALRAAGQGEAAPPSAATGAPDRTAIAAGATTLILAAALAAGCGTPARETRTHDAARSRRDQMSAVIADGRVSSFGVSGFRRPPRPARGRAPPGWGRSENWAGGGRVFACP